MHLQHNEPFSVIKNTFSVMHNLKTITDVPVSSFAFY